MTWRLLRLLSACVCLALLVPAATACINDRESDNAEKEFKSRYLDPSAPNEIPPAKPTPASDRLLLAGATGLGAILLIGSVAATVLSGRKRA